MSDLEKNIIQYGGKIGDFYNYSNDRTIKKIYYAKKPGILGIHWSGPKAVYTSPIKSRTRIGSNYIWVTESGSVYITNKIDTYERMPKIRGLY